MPHGRQLGRGREIRAAAPAQAGPRRLADQLAAMGREGTEASEVIDEAGRRWLGQETQQIRRDFEQRGHRRAFPDRTGAGAGAAAGGGAARPRHPRAAATSAATARPHTVGVSVPAARPCNIAKGQHAYAVQCTARHAWYPMCWRSRLVITSAASRSNATTPRPTPSGRYEPVNGTVAFTSRTGDT